MLPLRVTSKPYAHPSDLHSFPTRRSSDLYLQQKLGNYEPAEAYYKKALELDPDQSYLQYRYGSMLNQLGRFSEAEKYLRSEEHTSELQSLTKLVCRLLLEKKNGISNPITH